MFRQSLKPAPSGGPAAVALVLLLAAGTGGAFAQPADPAAGEAIAKRWCASCHLVTPDQEAAVAGVPSFKGIADTRDEAYIRGFLFDPHPPMPQFSLTESQVDDVVAFIRSKAD